MINDAFVLNIPLYLFIESRGNDWLSSHHNVLSNLFNLPTTDWTSTLLLVELFGAWVAADLV